MKITGFKIRNTGFQFFGSLNLSCLPEKSGHICDLFCMVLVMFNHVF